MRKKFGVTEREDNGPGNMIKVICIILTHEYT